MEILNSKLSTITAERILDVATRDGAFIKRLTQNLKGYGEIIGIDITEQGFAKAEEAFAADGRIRFQVMDGCHTDYDDQSFDLVCLVNSLHHIADIPALLAEMRRLRKDNGLILISEMTADGQTGASLTHALIHYLDCLTDTYQGIYHHLTYTRQEIEEMLTTAGLDVADAFYDIETDQKKNAAVGERVKKAVQKADACLQAVNYADIHRTALMIEENYRLCGANTAAQYVIFAR